jgi:hypothetical protein
MLGSTNAQGRATLLILLEKREQWLVLLRMGSRSRNESILNCWISVIG